jgi:hypothetical protein
MNEDGTHKNPATRRQISLVGCVYGLLAVAQAADLHSTSLGLGEGRIELNPLAQALADWVSPLATVIAIKAVAALLLSSLICVWVRREDGGDYFHHVLIVGVFPLVITSQVVWSNYQ